MKIQIICVGSLKESYWTEAAKEYSKRLSKYCTLSINELKEGRAPDNPSKADEIALIEEEGKSILKHIKKSSYVIALEIKGKEFSSEMLADKINSLAIQGNSEICFIIGGSLGLSQEVLRAADLKLSFSKMTFPHQMMRVILLEQIYRSYKIIKNEPYHK
ncbi:MAG: 23S rRNA (pseudouridine(1915)-N(3))-methyltransferase RlmH [Anaerovoracaceae bacterium]|jgi:23S rRNA (pseudouridine1915-N3)-methyltransferase